MLAHVVARRMGSAPVLAVLLLLALACATRTHTARDATTAKPAAPAPAARTEKPAPAQAPAVAAQTEKPAAKPPVAAADAVPPATPRGGPPADHLKDKHGVMHKRGYKRPVGACTDCHGKDLRGDGPAPSCYRCHGKEWH